jgi:hypothetical protein
VHNICMCCMGPFLSLTVKEVDDEDDRIECEEEEMDTDNNVVTEKGNCVFMTAIRPEEVDI